MRELIITGFRMWRESLLRWFRHCDSSHPALAIAMLILRKVSNLVRCLTVSRYKSWLDNHGYELLRIPLEEKKRGRTCLIFRDRYSFGGWHTTISQSENKSGRVPCSYYRHCLSGLLPRSKSPPWRWGYYSRSVCIFKVNLLTRL